MLDPLYSWSVEKQHLREERWWMIFISVFICVCSHSKASVPNYLWGAQAFLVSLTGNEGVLALCVSKAAGRSIIEKSAGPFTSHKVIRLHTAFPPNHQLYSLSVFVLEDCTSGGTLFLSWQGLLGKVANFQSGRKTVLIYLCYYFVFEGEWIQILC